MRTILVILLSIGIVGCTTLQKQQWKETGLIAAKRTAIAAGAAVLSAAVSQFDKEKKGDYLQGLSEALWQQAPAVINASTVEEIARVWTPNKSHWEDLAKALAADFETKKPRSKEEAQAILHAYAEGLYRSTEQTKPIAPEDDWLPRNYDPSKAVKKAEAWCCDPMAFFDHAEDCPNFPYGPRYIPTEARK